MTRTYLAAMCLALAMSDTALFDAGGRIGRSEQSLLLEAR